MRVFACVIVTALTGCAVAAPQALLPSAGYGRPPPVVAVPVYPDGPAVYDFSYGVNDQVTGVNFGHSEARDGVNTQGSYFVSLPDGRLQTVDYHADDASGYVADVKYTGEAVVPAYAPAPRPVLPAYAPAPAPAPVPAAPAYAPAPAPVYAPAPPPPPAPVYAPAPAPVYAPAPAPAYAPVPTPVFAPAPAPVIAPRPFAVPLAPRIAPVAFGVAAPQRFAVPVPAAPVAAAPLVPAGPIVTRVSAPFTKGPDGNIIGGDAPAAPAEAPAETPAEAPAEAPVEEAAETEE